MTVGVVDIQRILHRSKAGALVREVIQGSKGISTEREREQVLREMVFGDLTSLIQETGEQRGYSVILERQRAGVLYTTTEADLTPAVLRAYDIGTDAIIERDGRAARIQALRDQVEAVVKERRRRDSDSPGTGQYL